MTQQDPSPAVGHTGFSGPACSEQERPAEGALGPDHANDPAALRDRGQVGLKRDFGTNLRLFVSLLRNGGQMQILENDVGKIRRFLKCLRDY